MSIGLCAETLSEFDSVRSLEEDVWPVQLTPLLQCGVRSFAVILLRSSAIPDLSLPICLSEKTGLFFSGSRLPQDC